MQHGTSLSKTQCPFSVDEIKGVFVSSLEVTFLGILFPSLLLLGIIFLSKCLVKTKFPRNVYNIYLI